MQNNSLEWRQEANWHHLRNLEEKLYVLEETMRKLFSFYELLRFIPIFYYSYQLPMTLIFDIFILFFSEHAAELNNAVPTTPILFMKPPSCYLPNGGTIEVQLFILMIS